MGLGWVKRSGRDHQMHGICKRSVIKSRIPHMSSYVLKSRARSTYSMSSTPALGLSTSVSYSLGHRSKCQEVHPLLEVMSSGPLAPRY